nr:MAG TPA_asm: hypothetical protein [Bacteriophage sp.]
MNLYLRSDYVLCLMPNPICFNVSGFYFNIHCIILNLINL